MNEELKIKEVISKITGKKPVYLSVIKTANPGISTEEAEDIFTSELENFYTRTITYANEELSEGRSMPTMSILGGTNIFIEVLALGLSFSESAELIYLSRLKGSGTAISWTTTVKGDIYLASKSGAIRHVTDPVIAWVGDEFSVRTSACGTKQEVHHLSYNRERGQTFTFDNDFLAAYCWVVYSDGSRELSFIDYARMSEFRKLSSKPKNYDSISMLQSKMVKRALRLVNKHLMLGVSVPMIENFKKDPESYIIENPIVEEAKPEVNNNNTNQFNFEFNG